MFKDNLLSLRKMRAFSQEELASRLNISRQTLSKYETGESLPDINLCKRIADVFEVSLDDLVNYDSVDNMGVGIPPKGKYIFGAVKVGEKGQIVIPARARKIFDINSGDRLILLGDETQGLAMIKEQNILNLLKNAGSIEQ